MSAASRDSTGSPGTPGTPSSKRPTGLVAVAVPVAIDGTFTYVDPFADGRDEQPPLTAGERVLVPFGRRALAGIVRPIAVSAPEREGARLKAVTMRLDPPTQPLLSPELCKLCEWIADYYVAPVGEVYRAALPGLSTNVDVRRVAATPLGRDALTGVMTSSLERLLEAASQPEHASGGAAPDARKLAVVRRVLTTIVDAGEAGVDVSDLAALRPRVASPLATLELLEEVGLVRTVAEVVDPEDERQEVIVRRTLKLRGAEDEAVLAKLIGRAKKRRALLDRVELEDEGAWVSLADLRSEFPDAKRLVDALVDDGLLERTTRRKTLDPFAAQEIIRSEPPPPSPEQASALAILGERVDAREFTSVMLHGVTGSGKTEVYLQTIARARAQGRGAIVLVPEIALTPQLADRFRARFGDDVSVLHSGQSPRQRLEAWQRIRTGERMIAIGPRSAVFAPVRSLGVIVVDEEHDPSFKQEEGVRYHARDAALVRAKEAGALVILGSATPSLETWQRAQEGRHLSLTMTKRATPRPLPTIEIVSLVRHRPNPDTLMTARLEQALRDTVAAGEQAIVFLNRRGFATALTCASCGSMQQCPDCSAPSMTYHLQRNRLVCHLCGHVEAVPAACRACGGGPLEHGSAGTERVEVALEARFPGIRTLRLDRDASRGRKLLEVLGRFRAREADVLVGTQMLAKGHDFPGVTLVGVLQADHGLGLPDPRAAERVFQLLTQVAGRAGRGDRAGRVIVQAWAAEHPAIVAAAAHDWEGFVADELERRRELGNPPFGHLAVLRVSSLDEAQVRLRTTALADRAVALARRIREEGGTLDVRGPAPALFERVNGRTRWQLLLRTPSRPTLRRVLTALRPHLQGDRDVLTVVDVDPQTLV